MAIRDLGPLRLLIESRMIDTCTITRDPEGSGDDVLDQNTGALTPQAGDESTVYTGACLLYPAGRRQESQFTEGSRAVSEHSYDLRIPWDAAEPDVGDVVTLSVSTHDPTLVGRPLRVRSVARSTLLTSRDLVVEDRWSA